MIVEDLDGNKYEWRARGKTFLFDSSKGSGLHQSARSILKDRFPTIAILEEVSIKVRKRKTLYLDFYIPMRKLAIEVQGSQHFTFSSKFHGSKRDLLKQQKNDREKASWCELNDISLVTLRFDEVKDWENQL